MKAVKWGLVSLLTFVLLAPFGVFFPALGAYNPASLVGLATVTTLRAANYVQYPYMYLVGYNSFLDGGQGFIAYNASGSTDNGCTKFKDVSGHEFDRDVAGPMPVTYCGLTPNNSAAGTVTANTAALQNAFNLKIPISCFSVSTYWTNSLVIPTNYVVGTNTATPPFIYHGAPGCVIKFASTSGQFGIETANFGVRPSGSQPTNQVRYPVIDGMNLDISLLPQSSGNGGLAIDDALTVNINNLNITDLNGQGSLNAGLLIGRGVNWLSLTGYNTIGLVQVASAGTVSGVINNSVSLFFSGLQSYQLNLSYAGNWNLTNSAFFGAIPKIICSNTFSGVVAGNDFEGSNILYDTPGNNCSAIVSSGNNFAGFTGLLFSGAIPVGSQISDLSNSQGGLPLTGITRSGTVATACVNTGTTGGVYNYSAPPAKYGFFPTRITVSGDTASGSVLNGQFVVLSDTGTNCFTYAVPNSGPTASTGSPVAMIGSGGQYTSLLNGAIEYNNPGPSITLLGNTYIGGPSIPGAGVCLRDTNGVLYDLTISTAGTVSVTQPGSC